MAYGRIKTEHTGAKNGGGFWGPREDAKHYSRKRRRQIDKLEIAMTKKKKPYTPGDARQEAFEEIQPERSFLQSVIMSVLTNAGKAGLTCEEIEILSGMSHQTASARVNELAQAKAIVPNGKRRNRSGRHAVVWVRDSWRA